MRETAWTTMPGALTMPNGDPNGACRVGFALGEEHFAGAQFFLVLGIDPF